MTGEIFTNGDWHHLKVEVKTPEGKPTKRQLHRLRQYSARGYWVGIVTCVRDLKQLIDRYILGEEDGYRTPYYYTDLPYGDDIYAEDHDTPLEPSTADD